MPTVSVIIPTHNRAYCLARAIDSVLAQTYRDFELIVVDDGSTDATLDLLRGYDDPRLTVIRHETNKGVSAAINTGIRASSGGIIALQDSDDEWLPEKLERQLAVLRERPEVGVVYCDQWRIRGDERFVYPASRVMPEDGLIYRRALDDALHNIGNQSLVVRRELFDEAGLYDEALRKNVDLDMLIRLSEHALFFHMDEPLVNYYVTGESVTGRGEAEGIRTQEILFDKHYAALREDAALRGKRAYWIGSYCMRNGDARKGRHFLWIAVRAVPTKSRYLAGLTLSLLGSRVYRAVHQLLKRD